MQARQSTVERTTKETDIRLTLTLDGRGSASVDTGLGFFDHMLDALTKHARFDLELACSGDLEVDDHHTVEDCALAIGQALDAALGDRRGIRRFAHAYAPLDEAVIRCVIDLSGRAHAGVSLNFQRPMIGEVACENLSHFFQSLAVAGRMALHVDQIKGDNDHHIAEAAFKALALALRQAVSLDGHDEIPSTKGLL